ncbi:DeoR/GlpR family DNA-binding transcription regulator [uncultured Cellulomonas sp.]|uniref:DeoR/GlpR family DNA-binding transcription regulator n=1 Tax=uncultured Cellulomonas sp. TaxID=189682 RepID=UPI0026345205|nr:DeoR/GlpR family DNA-binding transcription regulator [uncultured Cellulomonas sp.]
MGIKRRQEILRRVQQAGYVSARDLAEEYGVDTSTLRRDLDALARLGLVIRNHGGASLPAEQSPAAAGDGTGQAPHRRAIGRAVAALIGDDRSVGLDGAPMTLEVARALRSVPGTTVVTNSLRVATELAAQGDVRLVVLGGEVLADRSTLVGDRATDLARDLQLDYAVVGADAVGPRGIAIADSFEAPVKRALIAAAATVVVVADSSAFGRSALVRLAGLDQVGLVVTDDGLPADVAATCGVEVVRVPVTDESA